MVFEGRLLEHNTLRSGGLAVRLHVSTRYGAANTHLGTSVYNWANRLQRYREVLQNHALDNFKDPRRMREG